MYNIFFYDSSSQSFTEILAFFCFFSLSSNLAPQLLHLPI